MASAFKSKANIRKQIVYALAHGTDRRKPGAEGLIKKLLDRLSAALDTVDTADIDGLSKLGQTVIRLSAIAMPTAYQAEALEKGLAPGAGQVTSHQEIFALLERTLAERRQLLSAQTTYIDVTPKPINDLRSAAKRELESRLTPPPVPPPGLVQTNDAGRGPTPTEFPLQEQVSGTRVSLDFNDVPAPEMPDLDVE